MQSLCSGTCRRYHIYAVRRTNIESGSHRVWYSNLTFTIGSEDQLLHLVSSTVHAATIVHGVTYQTTFHSAGISIPSITHSLSKHPLCRVTLPLTHRSPRTAIHLQAFTHHVAIFSPGTVPAFHHIVPLRQHHSPHFNGLVAPLSLHSYTSSIFRHLYTLPAIHHASSVPVPRSQPTPVFVTRAEASIKGHDTTCWLGPKTPSCPSWPTTSHPALPSTLVPTWRLRRHC